MAWILLDVMVIVGIDTDVVKPQPIGFLCKSTSGQVLKRHLICIKGVEKPLSIFSNSSGSSVVMGLTPGMRHFAVRKIYP
jgi:hypothetical protein